MLYPSPIRPASLATFNPEKMSKATIFQSERVMVGLNAFEPGQQHHLHAHADMDKVCHVLEGEGLFLLEDREVPMEAGVLLVAPQGVPHAIRNTSHERLIVLVVLAPAPPAGRPAWKPSEPFWPMVSPGPGVRAAATSG